MPDSTEQKIFAAAHEIFTQKGMDGAKMQEIADLAGINKALLHYYFKTKENLVREAHGPPPPGAHVVAQNPHQLWEATVESYIHKAMIRPMSVMWHCH